MNIFLCSPFSWNSFTKDTTNRPLKSRIFNIAVELFSNVYVIIELDPKGFIFCEYQGEFLIMKALEDDFRFDLISLFVIIEIAMDIITPN